MSNETIIPPHEPEAAVTPAPKRPWAKPTITIMGGPRMAQSGIPKAQSQEGGDQYRNLS